VSPTLDSVGGQACFGRKLSEKGGRSPDRKKKRTGRGGERGGRLKVKVRMPAQIAKKEKLRRRKSVF